MTACVVLDLLERFKLNPNRVCIDIFESSTTAVLGGTSAELLAGDRLSVSELLYAMMLPSGNDAAQSIAIYFGNYINLVNGGSSTSINANLKVDDFNEIE